MKNKAKIFSVILSLSMITQIAYPSFATGENNKNQSNDLVEFNEVDKNINPNKEYADLYIYKL